MAGAVGSKRGAAPARTTDQRNVSGCICFVDVGRGLRLVCFGLGARENDGEIGMTSNAVVETTGNSHHNGVGAGAVVSHGAGGGATGTPVVSESAALISMIERAARDTSVDIEKFERLMLMKERVERQHAIMAFNDAVAKAKGEFGPIAKNREVDYTSPKGRTNYKHEDFAGIAAVVDKVLKQNGLAYRFRSAQNGNKLSVTCILSHVRGHSEETTLEAAEDHSGNKNAIQAIGSATTYLQRYTLKLALGLASSHDDDARAAGGNNTETITEDQAEQIKEAIDRTGAELGRFCAYYKLEKLTDLPVSKFASALQAIEVSAKKRSVQ